MRARWIPGASLVLAIAAVAAAQTPPAPPSPAPAAAPATAHPPAPATPPSPVTGIRNKISAGDLPSAESMLEVHKDRYGESASWLSGLAWLARGALLTGDTAKARRYADEVRIRVDRRLATGGTLEKDTLETPLGASIEVVAQLLAHDRGPKAAAEYVRGELARRKGPAAFQSRLNKRINMLELTGARAPEIAIEDTLGRAPTLASLKGRPVLLFLWAEWCGDARAQAASLVKARSAGPKDLQVIALTRYYEDSTAARVRERARVDSVWKADYAALRDVPIVFSTASMIRYGGSSTPTFVFVDRTGVVRRYTPTRLTAEDLTATLAALKP